MSAITIIRLLCTFTYLCAVYFAKDTLLRFTIIIIFSGLDHEQNVKKMRILSFMQMAETNPELSYDEITSELQIEEKDVEAFIIEGTFIVIFTIGRFLLLLEIATRTTRD